jgi:hypothetical protein
MFLKIHLKRFAKFYIYNNIKSSLVYICTSVHALYKQNYIRKSYLLTV